MYYLTGNGKYSLNYQELKEDYLQFARLSDADFLKRIPSILHFACITTYLKHLGRDTTIGDEGIIHQLIHLLVGEAETPLDEIREQFNEVCRLV